VGSDDLTDERHERFDDRSSSAMLLSDDRGRAGTDTGNLYCCQKYRQAVIRAGNDPTTGFLKAHLARFCAEPDKPAPAIRRG